MTKRNTNFNPRVVLNRLKNCDKKIAEKQSEKLCEKMSSPSSNVNSSAPMASTSTPIMAANNPSGENSTVQRNGSQSDASQSDMTLINLNISDVEIVDENNVAILTSERRNNHVIMLLLNVSASSFSNLSNLSQIGSSAPAIAQAVDSKENILGGTTRNETQSIDRLNDEPNSSATSTDKKAESSQTTPDYVIEISSDSDSGGSDTECTRHNANVTEIVMKKEKIDDEENVVAFPNEIVATNSDHPDVSETDVGNYVEQPASSVNELSTENASQSLEHQPGSNDPTAVQLEVRSNDAEDNDSSAVVIDVVDPAKQLEVRSNDAEDNDSSAVAVDVVEPSKRLEVCTNDGDRNVTQNHSVAVVTDDIVDREQVELAVAVIAPSDKHVVEALESNGTDLASNELITDTANQPMECDSDSTDSIDRMIRGDSNDDDVARMVVVQSAQRIIESSPVEAIENNDENGDDDLLSQRVLFSSEHVDGGDGELSNDSFHLVIDEKSNENNSAALDDSDNVTQSLHEDDDPQNLDGDAIIKEDYTYDAQLTMNGTESSEEPPKSNDDMTFEECHTAHLLAKLCQPTNTNLFIEHRSMSDDEIVTAGRYGVQVKYEKHGLLAASASFSFESKTSAGGEILPMKDVLPTPVVVSENSAPSTEQMVSLMASETLSDSYDDDLNAEQLGTGDDVENEKIVDVERNGNVDNDDMSQRPSSTQEDPRLLCKRKHIASNVVDCIVIPQKRLKIQISIDDRNDRKVEIVGEERLASPQPKKSPKMSIQTVSKKFMLNVREQRKKLRTKLARKRTNLPKKQGTSAGNFTITKYR